MRRVLIGLVVASASVLTACSFNIDAMIFNGVHCSAVGPEFCEDEEDYWDRVCKTCDEDYDWTIDYDWFEGSLADGQTIRAIEPDTIENVRLETTDGLGELDTYFIPAHGERADLADTLILHTHGNFRSIEHYQVRLRFLHEYGANVIGWDYRGYGKSEPETTPSAVQLMEDAELLLEYAREVADDDTKIVLYGHSIGAISAVQQAVVAEEGGGSTPCALILETPFTSTSEIAHSVSGVRMPGGFLSSGHFANDVKLTRYTGPLFAMSAGNEDRFPSETVQRLVDASGGPSDHWIEPDAYHGLVAGGIPEQGVTAYFDELDGFFATLAPECLTN